MYAEIVVPSLKSITSKQSYTYKIPTSLKPKCQIGTLVLAPFGKKKIEGIITKITTQKPSFETKSITSISQPFKLLTKPQTKLIDLISSYYLSSPHRISKLMTPSKWGKTKWQPQTTKKAPFAIKQTKQIKELKPQPEKFFELTEEQSKTINSITETLKAPTPHLIWGPTGSGKTEIYKQLIKKLPQTKQALIIVPEISLTPQLAQYFINAFPNEVAIWHSQLNESERNNIWWRTRFNQDRIIIGSRSSLFLPFNNLGTIIIDEEHSHSLKQEQDPRYHARTVGQWLSKIHNCPLILGSATPCLETYQAATSNRIQLHKLTKRVNQKPHPEVNIVDMRLEIQQGNFGIFSEDLKSAISQTLNQNKQALLFLNRRGFANTLHCLDCGNTIECPNCDISLTVHQSTKTSFLQCHLCSQTVSTPTNCSNCQGVKLKQIGVGTQQIQTEVEKLFPQAKILRADRDTTTQKDSFNQIYNKFKNHEADILIGTQMISKGLHLPNVDLVGIIMADIGLHIPDFRATEVSLQNIVQVCGRAGRGHNKGQVIIQTLSPKHPVFKFVSDPTNLEEFYLQELLTRQQHNYPPSIHITKLTCVAANKNDCLNQAKQVEKQLEEAKLKFLGSPALIFRQHNKYHYHIILFINNITPVLESLKLSPNWRIDRDPISVI